MGKKKQLPVQNVFAQKSVNGQMMDHGHHQQQNDDDRRFHDVFSHRISSRCGLLHMVIPEFEHLLFILIVEQTDDAVFSRFLEGEIGRQDTIVVFQGIFLL